MPLQIILEDILKIRLAELSKKFSKILLIKRERNERNKLLWSRIM